jgi:hypothetical protein
MKLSIILFFILSYQSLASDIATGVEQQQIKAMYLKRDSIAEGLSKLSYDVCTKSRIMKLSKFKQLQNKKIESQSTPELSGCLSLDCAQPKDPRVVLPLTKDGYREQKAMSGAMNWILNKKDKKAGFFQKFNNRLSCLQGPGIKLACQLLQPQLSAPQAGASTISNSNFKNQFDAARACEVAESKQKYVQALRNIQAEINKLEEKIQKRSKKKRRKRRQQLDQPFSSSAGL